MAAGSSRWSDRADPPGRPRRRRRHDQPRRERPARRGRLLGGSGPDRLVLDVVHGSTSYPAAVRHGLGLAPATGPDEWVWLLHDDSNPEPTALAELLAAAEAHPDAAILGPKLREWPSLRRLLEVGLTITGTGRRETGLERGEYDQGQHDEVREVLAVNTAGMLVRREVLESLGGLDEDLPIFGNDIDFGWRAALAGHRTIVVPQAVVFHAEAAHRGIRRTPLTGRHTHYQERRAALLTSLANVSGAQLRLALRPPLPRLDPPRARLLRGPRGGGGLRRARRRPVRARATGPGAGRAPGARPAPRGRAHATYDTCWRRRGCPTGTGSTSSPTSGRRSPARPPTSPSGGGPPGPRTRGRLPSSGARPPGRARTTRRPTSPTAGWWRASSPTRSRSCW